MGRIYSVAYTGSITAAGGDTDILSAQPADDKPIKLRGMLLSQYSEVGDAQEEGLRVTIRRMGATFTVGSGGSLVTAATPVHDSADPVWGFTARCNDTTVATTSGTNDIKAELAWNIRQSPFDLWFPEERFAFKAKQAEGLVVRLETTVGSTISVCLTFWIEEE